MKPFEKFILFSSILICVIGLRSEDQKKSPPDHLLRILDINVWSGLNYKGYVKMSEYETDGVREKRYQALLAQIKELDPDIIGIHEANTLPDYANKLAEATGYAPFYHVALGGVRLGPIGLPWNLREGDVILVKKTLNPQFVGRKQLAGGYVGNWMTFHFSDATQIIAVKIIYNEKPIFIFTTHWHASLFNSTHVMEKAKEWLDMGKVSQDDYQKILSRINKDVQLRLSESEKTIEFIHQIAKNDPYVLIGDFNAELVSQEIEKLLHFNMIDVYKVANPDSSGFTWDPRSNLNCRVQYMKDAFPEENLDSYEQLKMYDRAIPKRIDYIFLGPCSFWDSQSIYIKSSQVVMKKIVNGVQASDHYGIYAEIAIDE